MTSFAKAKHKLNKMSEIEKATGLTNGKKKMINEDYLEIPYVMGEGKNMLKYYV